MKAPLLAGVAFAALLSACGASHPSSAPPKPTTAPTPVNRTPEECGAVQQTQDGNVRPVLCPDGRPNILADQYLRRSNLEILKLGPTATEHEVAAAISADMGASSCPIETSAYILAAAEEGWHFPDSPIDIVCPVGQPE